MKMHKEMNIKNLVLKNAKVWNGQSFENRDEFSVIQGKDLAAEEFDCNGALVMPALFGLGVDFMEPLRDDVYTFQMASKLCTVAALAEPCTKVLQIRLTMLTSFRL